MINDNAVCSVTTPNRDEEVIEVFNLGFQKMFRVYQLSQNSACQLTASSVSTLLLTYILTYLLH